MLDFMIYMTFQRINSRGLLCFWLNTAAAFEAAFVLISLTPNFNLASALIQVLWVGLGIIAIVTRLSRPSAVT